MSAKDLRGLLFEPVIALPLLPLSKRASTDSCSILFSFLTIISGAFSSINLLSLLFLFITLLYRSLRSEVANLPPSRGTKGLKSGGNTGNTSRIIHSGLLEELLNDFMIFILLESFFIFASDLVSVICCSIKAISSSKSISIRSVLTASAPIPALNSSP